MHLTVYSKLKIFYSFAVGLDNTVLGFILKDFSKKFAQVLTCENPTGIFSMA
jgi:hypothetical protein